MGKILCATRGGQDSQPSQHAAIALAREQGHELVFLYVADASFLNTIAMPLVVDVEQELDRMGRFQLAIAQEHAAEQGVNAELAIRHGQLHPELIAAARELGATVIILGQPQGEDAVFDSQALHAFAHDLQLQTGAEVLIV